MSEKKGPNISASKLLFNLDRASGDFRPITADIFLNNYCNNECPYCTYKRWEHEPGAWFLKIHDFMMYAERLRELGVRGFILTGGGEPTINPDFDKITAWLDEQGYPYGINTNFNVYREPKPRYLKVSLDGWDEDSYERQRGVRRYERVKKNIIKYAEWKAENSPGTSLGVQMVATEVDDVFRFYEANKELPVDYMVYRPVESTAGAYYKDKANMDKVQPILEAVNKIREGDERVVLNFKFNLLDVACKKCFSNWAQIAMNEKGDIMYCCHKPYQIVGHVMDRSILSKKAQAETDMVMCDIPCRLTDANMLMQKVEEGAKDPFFI